MTRDDYLGINQKVKEFENQLTELLDVDYSDKHQKLRAFIKRHYFFSIQLSRMPYNSAGFIGLEM